MLLLIMLSAGFHVLRTDGTPVPGAWVGIPGRWLGATDADGYYYLEDHFSDTLCVHATGFADWTGPAPEPEGVILLSTSVIDTGERIIVRASRGSLAGAVPSTDTVSGDRLLKLGSSGFGGLNGMIPGVSVREYGGSMPVVSISLRGGDPSQSGYMLDGVSVVSPRDGMPSGIFDTAVFSGIEIARGGAGPGGSGTGSAGAVNFLPPGASEPLTVLLSGSSNGAARISGKIRGTGLSIRRNIGTGGTEGYSASLLATGSHTCFKGGFLGSWASGDTESPDWTLQGDGYREQGQAEGWLNWASGAVEGDLSAGLGRMTYSQSDPYTVDDTHTDWSGRAALAWKGMVTLRAGATYAVVQSTATGHHGLGFGTLGVERSAGIMQASAGCRLDGTAAEFSGRINLRENVPETGIAVRASVFTDHRVPTLNDLYWPFDGRTSGNPDLKDERTVGGEAGLLFENPSLRAGICGFTAYTDNLIMWLPDGEGVWTPSNISSSLSRGLEAEGELCAGFCSLSGTFTWNIATDETEDTPREGMLLPYRPEYVWGVGAAADIPWGISAGISLSGTGLRFTNRTQTEFLDEYLLIDVSAAGSISDGIRLIFTTENVLNTDYQVTSGFPGGGTTLGITLEYTGE